MVTGSVSSGQAQVGDELSIEPGGLQVRVRGLQNHDRPAEQVHRGQRAAINLAGVHHEGIQRGQELATPGHLRPSRLLTVHLRAVDGVVRPIKNRSRVRVHVGTAELLGTLVLLDADALGAGTRRPGRNCISPSRPSRRGANRSSFAASRPCRRSAADRCSCRMRNDCGAMCRRHWLV